MRRALASLLLAVLVAACGAAPPRTAYGAGPVASVLTGPPMGWNSWNELGCAIDEATIRAEAEALASSGLAAAGYRYVVVDDCWVASNRADDGSLQADATRFPSGMAALADEVHRLGLRFGIYSSAGTKTCMQRAGLWPGATGSLGHEAQDAATFAAWGVDFLKYDLCTPEDELDDVEGAFQRMGDALVATGRPIVYSINANSFRADTDLGTSVDWSRTATMARTGFDIVPEWTTTMPGLVGVLDAAQATAALPRRFGPASWYDPDMLVVGVDRVVGGIGGYADLHPTLTADEARTHLALWAMLGAPLVIGADLRSLSEANRALLVDAQLVAIDQDPSATATIERTDAAHQVWRRTLADGTVVRLTVDLATHGSTLQVTAP